MHKPQHTPKMPPTQELTLDIQGHLLRIYLDTKNMPKTPNLRRYLDVYGV